MKKFFTFFCLVSCLNGFVPAISWALAEKKESLSLEIPRIMKKYKIESSQMGIQINLNSEILYANENEKLLIPASISKLFTAYSLLSRLGPTFKTKTELFFDGKHLYLKGGGDPGFVSESLWFLVNEFVRRDIKSIPGDIVVDDSLFDGVRFDPSRESVRVDRAYDSPVGAASFNWNAINIFVRPSEKIGTNGIVKLDPENSYFKLVNQTKTAQKIKQELIIDVNQEAKTITVRGDVLFGSPEKPYYKNVADPSLWLGDNLKSFLKQRGISVSGKIRVGVAPQDADKVAIFESKSLSSMVSDMNKFSNNYVAEMLTKLLAANQKMSSKTRAFSIEDGMSLISKDIQQITKSNSKIVIENPSGFSRNNRVTAKAMNELLIAAKENFSIFPSFLESLPIAGLDGTMKRRMKGMNAEGLVRAKTGLLNGVIALSGFAGGTNGDVFHFTFLYNGPQDGEVVRDAVDQMISLLLK